MFPQIYWSFFVRFFSFLFELTCSLKCNGLCLVSFFPAEEEEELKKSAVVNWYLSEIESEIDSEEELINRKSLIEKVLNRLVHYVSTTTQFTGPHHAGPQIDTLV